VELEYEAGKVLKVSAPHAPISLLELLFIQSAIMLSEAYTPHADEHACGGAAAGISPGVKYCSSDDKTEYRQVENQRNWFFRI
jgi:hypothetical protein